MSGEHGQVSTRPVVDVHAIEEELAEVRWKLRPDGEMDEAAQHAAAEARANVLNLIVVVEDESGMEHVHRVLDGLSTHHPSRTLILLAQEERQAVKLEASVSAQTRTDSGHRVTTEQVLLHAHGQVAAHLASLVSPLLVPDLPVMLWWPGRPDFESQLFNELADLCDRLVVDTDDRGVEPGRDFPLLLNVARRRKARVAIGDFNWARLMPWRHLMAQFFDPPSVRSRLISAHGVTVWYGGEGSNAQALLLAGWVQSRLAAIGVPIPRELRYDPGLPYGVSRFMLYTGGEDGVSRFSIARAPGGRLTTQMRIGDQEQLGRTVAVAPRSADDLLAIELTIPGHDVLYEQALEAAVG